MAAMYRTLRAWSARRWLTALAATAVGVLVVAVPTDLLDTRFFGREVPPTWWSWPALLAGALLAGLLVATYVREPGVPEEAPSEEERRSRWWGGAGGLLTFFAVGCPVCNKLVLLALGASGAMTYFEPVQPVLSVLALLVLAWALARRLEGQVACAVPALPRRDAARRGRTVRSRGVAWKPPSGTTGTPRRGSGRSNRTALPRS